MSSKQVGFTSSSSNILSGAEITALIAELDQFCENCYTDEDITALVAGYLTDNLEQLLADSDLIGEIQASTIKSISDVNSDGLYDITLQDGTTITTTIPVDVDTPHITIKDVVPNTATGFYDVISTDGTNDFVTATKILIDVDTDHVVPVGMEDSDNDGFYNILMSDGSNVETKVPVDVDLEDGEHLHFKEITDKAIVFGVVSDDTENATTHDDVLVPMDKLIEVLNEQNPVTALHNKYVGVDNGNLVFKVVNDADESASGHADQLIPLADINLPAIHFKYKSTDDAANTITFSVVNDLDESATNHADVVVPLPVRIQYTTCHGEALKDHKALVSATLKGIPKKGTVVVSDEKCALPSDVRHDPGTAMFIEGEVTKDVTVSDTTFATVMGAYFIKLVDSARVSVFNSYKSVLTKCSNVLVSIYDTTIADGAYSFVFGRAHKIKSMSYSTVGGYKNTVDACKGSFIIGSTLSPADFSYGFMSGVKNSSAGKSAYGAVFGANNKFAGSYNHQSGDYNKLTAASSRTMQHGRKLDIRAGNYKVQFGRKHVDKAGSYNIQVGNSHVNEAGNGVAQLGYSHTNKGNYITQLGHGHTNEGSYATQLGRAGSLSAKNDAIGIGYEVKHGVDFGIQIGGERNKLGIGKEPVSIPTVAAGANVAQLIAALKTVGYIK